MRTAELVVDGLGFGEGLRWRSGRLYFSDFLQQHIASVGVTGDLRVEFELDDRPSGLGWLPDGRLLAVSMRRRAVLRQEGAELVVHADLAELLPGDANDMVVDADGTAYVGNFGSDVLGGALPRPTRLVMVRADGFAEQVGPELEFPNGSVITAEHELVVGETMGHRYRAFTIAEDGTLGDTRVWADLGKRLPDGCALDDEGAIWFANAGGREVVRVAEGGDVLDVIETEQTAYACGLGGDSGRTLYYVTAPTHPGDDAPIDGGRLWCVNV